MEHIIKTTTTNEVIEVTEIIMEDLKQSSVSSGIVTVSVPHTTVGIAIKENVVSEAKQRANIIYDVTDIVNRDLHHTGVTEDITKTFVPNSAVAMASVIGGSVKILIDNGAMKLSSGQGIYLYEFDGPKTRNINVKIIHG